MKYMIDLPEAEIEYHHSFVRKTKKVTCKECGNTEHKTVPPKRGYGNLSQEEQLELANRFLDVTKKELGADWLKVVRDSHQRKPVIVVKQWPDGWLEYNGVVIFTDKAA